MKPPPEFYRPVVDDPALAAGCYFEIEAAERVRDFFRKFLRHSKGQWAGQPFELLDWQWHDIIGPLFGWMRADGTRRFRRAYIEIPKKNGKSFLGSAIALYLMIADGEPGAEVYSAAADREQASIIYNEAESMVKASSELSDHVICTTSRKTLSFERTQSMYKALSADVPTKDGLNIHGLLFDELHTQKNRDLWDKLTYGGASRRQPLLISITTAGWDHHSICYEQHQYAEQVLDARIEDWSFLPYIRAAPEDADWTDPEVWKACNPSLGEILNMDEFTESCSQAQASPVKENTFKRYRLCIWTEQDVRWLQMAAWDKCDGAVGDMKGRRCFAGLDLSSTTDISAFVLCFPDDGGFILKPYFWIPLLNAHERERRDKVPYLTWARQGYIEMTEGNVIDYDVIRRRVNEIGEEYNIVEIAFDRWNATQIATQLDGDGFEIIPFGQGYKSMSPPTKDLEKLILGGKIVHGGNPVLRWMAGNVSVETDAAGNVKASKKKSPEKIDGIVAAIMGIGRANVDEGDDTSVYDTRGLVII